MMIKPDAVERGLTGKILSDIIDNGFEIVALKLTKLSLEDAKSFYFVHNERPFFKDLTEYMSRSSIVAAVIKKENAVRAVANAIGKNPYPIRIPCHRVIRSDGSLGGYSGPGGIKMKKRLLKKELKS